MDGDQDSSVQQVPSTVYKKGEEPRRDNLAQRSGVQVENGTSSRGWFDGWFGQSSSEKTKQPEINAASNVVVNVNVKAADLGLNKGGGATQRSGYEEEGTSSGEMKLSYMYNGQRIQRTYNKKTRLQDVTGYIYQEHDIPKMEDTTKFVQYPESVTQGRDLEGGGTALSSDVTFGALPKDVVLITIHELATGRQL